MARTLAIKYGTLTVGLTPSNAAFNLTDKYEHAEDFDAGTFLLHFTVVVLAATQAALITAEQALVDGITKRDQRTTIELSGGQRRDYNPTAGASGNTGFHSRGTAHKRGTRTDTQYSSEWECTITGSLPEDTAGRDGRRSGSIRVTDREGTTRRRVVFEGRYTALTSNGAEAQYLAAVSGWITPYLTALTGTWYTGVEDYNYDDENKVLAFSHERIEVESDARLEGFLERSTDPSERQFVVIRGVYTDALPATSAKSAYDAGVDAFTSGLLTPLGGTWNTVGKSFQHENANRLLRFEHRFERILLDESLAGADLGAVVFQQLTIHRSGFGDRRAGALGFSLARPYDLLVIEYSASIRSSVTTDLDTLYEGTIRPHIVTQANPSGALIITRDEKYLDKANNRLQGRITARVEVSPIIDSRVAVEIASDFGAILLPVWDGNPYSRRRYQGIASQTVTVVVHILRTPGVVIDARKALPPFLSQASWIQVFHRAESDEFDIGNDKGSIQRLVDMTDFFVFARADEPAGGEGGDAGGDAGGGTVGGDAGGEESIFESAAQSRADAAERIRQPGFFEGLDAGGGD